MAETITLSKLLHVYENERKDAQRAYHHALAFFEDIATQLYTLLRKKEDAETLYDNSLPITVPLEKIKGQVAYIERLNHQILRLQQQVQHARSDMHSKQLKLTDAHVEVKKYEKIIDTRIKSEKEVEAKREKASMDEISIQQFLSHKNR
ncbi:flagellar export protein FliJ [Virgibacillus sp. NKC19-16]|uniref:flagellar export protein FliJ n=1 Tax=Virgibacillus salidurans TaxID=2831673 RepID=UPI001F2E7160|nr:flagellar export protein FliJ [Virgibacillus sp. NKC19-16]UJL47938.1 flagellar export protein FliJ [Virgibacillus sp. NKC19-16]